MKKKIGLSFCKGNFQNYLDWFTKEDLLDDIDLVKLSFIENNAEDISKCDGFILTGGVDIHPSFYNGEKMYENSPSTHQIERDQFEEKIYQYSQANKLPVLGICRGMQLINALQGGKLIQDLDNGNARHRKEAEDKEHTIISGNGTLLYEIAGSGSGNVNSAHHQAIDPTALGDNLKVNAYDGDNEKIIEGLEFADKTDTGFMLCVQWHPERMKDRDANPFSQKIKERFLKEIRNIKNENH
jgi:putative glutamine amidotransferase